MATGAEIKKRPHAVPHNGHSKKSHHNGAGQHEATAVCQEILRLSEAAREGRLTERGRAEQFDGVYREMLEGVNTMLEAIQNTTADYQSLLAAINKSQAIIEFKMDGTILTANDNFLNAMGYTLDELKGRHHSMLVEDAYRQSSDYRELWQN
jgi:PAS domain-containing protein